MKKITAFLYILIISSGAYSQSVEQFVGEFLVTEIYTIVAGEMTGYTDTVEFTIEINKKNGNQISISNFSNNFVSVLADVYQDSITIFSQSFSDYNGKIYYNGSGKIINDTLEFTYRAGGSFGVAKCECTAVRLVEDKVSEYDNHNKTTTFYPMPFKDRTSIEIEVPEQIQNARMLIYSIIGKEVYNTEIKDRGTITLNIEGDNLSSGCFTCIFVFDNKVERYCKIVKTE